MMRVLVCGGRDFNDEALLERILNGTHGYEPFTLLIHGGARGADTLAAAWAKRNGVAVEAHPANWKEHSRAAGPLRNIKMIKREPKLVIAFPGGPGTADMVMRAKAAGVTVMEVR
jgi:hypothetical protein